MGSGGDFGFTKDNSEEEALARAQNEEWRVREIERRERERMDLQASMRAFSNQTSDLNIASIIDLLIPQARARAAIPPVVNRDLRITENA